MPQYAAIIYSKDVDWTQPEYADRHEGVQRVRPGRRRRHPRRRRAVPDQHRHHRPRAGRQGRRRGHHRRPLRRDQGGAHRLLPAGVRRPRRGRSPSPPDPRRRGTAPSRCGRSSSSAGERADRHADAGTVAALVRLVRDEGGPCWPRSSRRHRRPRPRRGRRAGRRRARAGDVAPRRRAREPAGLAHAHRPPPRHRRPPPRGDARPGRRPRRCAASRRRRAPASASRCATTCCGWCSPAATRASPLETQVALSLRTLCGLSTAEVARGPAGARGDHGQAPHPGPPEDRAWPRSRTGCPPTTSCPTGCAGVRRHRLPGVQRRLRAPPRATTCGPTLVDEAVRLGPAAASS